MSMRPLFLMLMALPLCSQVAPENPSEVPIPHYALTRVASVVSQDQQPFGFYGDAVCDEDDNVYVRPDVGVHMDRSPIWEFSPRAEKMAEFTLPPKVAGDLMPTYAVSPMGEVYAAIYDEKGTYLLHLNKDGDDASKTPLQVESGFVPEMMAIFASGEALVSGYLEENGVPSMSKRKHLTAIFNMSGQMLRDLGGYDPALDAGANSPAQYAVAMARDGNAYRLQGKRIRVLSPNGDVIRTFQLSPPDAKHVPVRVQVSGGLLSVSFVEVKDHRPEYIFRTYDTHTGELRAQYNLSRDLPNAELCFSSTDGYLTIATKDGKFGFARAWVQ